MSPVCCQNLDFVQFLAYSDFDLSTVMGVQLCLKSHWPNEDQGELRYGFEQSRILIGRSSSADVRIPHPAISLRHAVISHESSDYYIEDLDSTNGTYVNGEPIVARKKYKLRSGDRLALGGFGVFFDSGVPVANPVSADESAALARALLRARLEAQAHEEVWATLTCTQGEVSTTTLRLAVRDEPYTLGEGTDCDVQLGGLVVDGAPFNLTADWGRTVIYDLSREPRMLINNKPCNERVLKRGDVLELGSTTWRYDDAADKALDESEQNDDLILKDHPASLDNAWQRALLDDSDKGRPVRVSTRPPVRKADKTSNRPAALAEHERHSSWIERNQTELLIWTLASLIVFSSIGALIYLFSKR